MKTLQIGVYTKHALICHRKFMQISILLPYVSENTQSNSLESLED